MVVCSQLVWFSGEEPVSHMMIMYCCRVFSEKGLPYLAKEFPKLKFKGKGHEVKLLLCLFAQL